MNTLSERYAHGGGSILFSSDTPGEDLDRRIWSLLIAGNRQALDFIFEKNVRVLYAYGSKICKDRSIVEDCIQDLFVELWNRREALGTTSCIKFYLLKAIRRKIARRMSNDNRILGSADMQFTNDPVSFSVEFNLIQDQTTAEQKQRLTCALAVLTERQREVIYLRFWEKMEYPEIAEVMNLTIKSTYKLMGKAIDTLRQALPPFR